MAEAVSMGVVRVDAGSRPVLAPTQLIITARCGVSGAGGCFAVFRGGRTSVDRQSGCAPISHKHESEINSGVQDLC